MKHKIIKTENYLLVVDDSEIKAGDWFYFKHFGDDIISQAKENTDLVNLNKSDRFFRKITTHLPLNNSPVLQGVDLLPPLEQEDNVEKIAVDFYEFWYDKYGNSEIDAIERKANIRGFNGGYNAHKELVKDKLFTVEDMRRAILMAWDSSVDTKNIDDIIQSLSQPEMPVGFECEIELYDEGGFSPERQIKTTTNSRGQTVWVGKYIY